MGSAGDGPEQRAARPATCQLTPHGTWDQGARGLDVTGCVGPLAARRRCDPRLKCSTGPVAGWLRRKVSCGGHRDCFSKTSVAPTWSKTISPRESCPASPGRPEPQALPGTWQSWASFHRRKAGWGSVGPRLRPGWLFTVPGAAEQGQGELCPGGGAADSPEDTGEGTVLGAGPGSRGAWGGLRDGACAMPPQ